MNNNKKTCYVIGLVVAFFAICHLPIYAQDEPQSTIQSDSGDFYVPFEFDTPLGLSTAETPTPACPDDPTDGPPTYYWDFGTLDGVDNGDGTADIDTDTSGSCSVVVYCEQEFIDSDGDDYPEDTQTSD